MGYLHCGETNVRTRANTAFSIYNGLQASLTTKNYHGITATAAYTYSQTIDNSSEIFGTFTGGNTVTFSQNPFNNNIGERAESGISFPNVASISFSYSVPTFGSANTLVGKLVNGWQMNTIWIYNSGQPFTDYDFTTNSSPNTNPNDPYTYTSLGDANESAAFSSGVDFSRPIVSNPKAPVTTVGLYTTTTNSSGVNSAPFLVDYATGNPTTPSQVHWISNNVYAALLAGTPYPGWGRNLLRGNTFNNVDTSVYKNTKLTERFTLRIEATAYNILNRSYTMYAAGSWGCSMMERRVRGRRLAKKRAAPLNQNIARLNSRTRRNIW